MQFYLEGVTVILRNKINDFLESVTLWKDLLLVRVTYAAIPYGNQLMIIHNGEQLKVCKTEVSARKFIDDHKKGKSQAQLPVN